MTHWKHVKVKRKPQMSLCALMRLFSRHHSCIALHCFSCTSTSTSALFLVSVGELVPGPVLAIMTWQVYFVYEASLQFHATHIKIVEVTEEDFVLTPVLFSDCCLCSGWAISPTSSWTKPARPRSQSLWSPSVFCLKPKDRSGDKLTRSGPQSL